jgi:hypothetical protein
MFYLIVRSHRIGMPSAIWREIQEALLYVWFDALVLWDCCFPASAAKGAGEHRDSPYGRIELLAAADNGAKTPQPGDNSFTSVMISRMEEMITKYGSIDIAKLHALLVQPGTDLYTTPFYVSSRAGASQRTIVLEKLKAPRKQKQNLTKWKPYTISIPRTGRMRLPLKSLRFKGRQEQGRWTRGMHLW